MFSKSDPMILIQNPMQVEDDLNASEDSAKTEREFMTGSRKHYAMIDHP